MSYFPLKDLAYFGGQERNPGVEVFVHSVRKSDKLHSLQVQPPAAAFNPVVPPAHQAKRRRNSGGVCSLDSDSVPRATYFAGVAAAGAVPWAAARAVRRASCKVLTSSV